jgi:adenylate cyclase
MTSRWDGTVANETKLAVILHADVVGSTELVQANEALAHERIQSAFLSLAELTKSHGGQAHEIRGDALVAEFPRPSDAVNTAMQFQAEHLTTLEAIEGEIRPQLRIGVAMGEVIVADNMITGAGVVMAQRIEQLSAPGGVCISGAVQESLPGSLKYDYEDLGEHQLKGFKRAQRAFAVHLRGLDQPAGTASQDNGTPGAGAMQFSGTSLAVLPFESQGNDPDGDFLADGLTEDITNAMSSLRWLAVISRASAVEVASRTTDVRQVGTELDVRYVVTGTVRKAGARVRVTANLNETRSGRQIWSKRFDQVVEDVFEILDEVSRSVAAELTPELTSGDLASLVTKAPQNLSAWEAYQRGTAELLRRGHAKEAMDKATEYFERAIEHDPRFASAYGALGHVFWVRMIRGLCPDTGAAIDEMFSLAAKAIALDPRDSTSRVVRGLAHFLRGDYDAAIAELDAAVSLNPSSTLALALRGGAKTWSFSDHEGALIDLESARKLSPTDAESRLFRLGAGACANFYLGRFDEAARLGDEAFHGGGFFGTLNGIAACVAAGDLERARRRLADFIALHPELSIERIREIGFFMPEGHDWERWLAAIEQAGLPQHSN